MLVCSIVSNSSWPHWQLTCEAPWSMGLSKQEYWNGLPFPPPEDLSDPGIELTSPFLLHCLQILYCLSCRGSLYIHKIKEGREPKNYAFMLWCWRRLLRVSWTARRSKQPILREINPEYSLEGLRLKLKLQVFWSPDVANASEKSQMLGKIEGRRREGIRGWDGWMASSMHWTWTWANFRRWWGTGRPGMLQSMGLQRSRHDWMTEQQIK